MPRASLPAREKPAPPRPSPDVAPVARAELPANAQNTPAQTGAPPGIPLPGLAGAVRRVDIEFEVYTGGDRKFAGKGRHRFISQNDEYYSVSVAQAEGAWHIEVNGRVTRQGLHPAFFEVQGAASERLVDLREAAGTVASPARLRKARMSDGLLDLQSLFYQFMVQPPELGGGKLWLSDGLTNGPFTYRVAGFDSLPLVALGGVRAIKLVISADDGPETIELWLVPDMHYLPVKLRHTDRQGNVTAQVALSLGFN